MTCIIVLYVSLPVIYATSMQVVNYKVVSEYYSCIIIRTRIIYACVTPKSTDKIITLQYYTGNTSRALETRRTRRHRFKSYGSVQYFKHPSVGQRCQRFYIYIRIIIIKVWLDVVFNVHYTRRSFSVRFCTIFTALMPAFL